MGRRRRGNVGGAMLEKQQRYAQLIGQGVSNSQACRTVGIDRRTGTRWKYGRTVLNVAGEPVHYQPVRIRDQKQRHARYLSVEERCTIADLRREGLGVRVIAARIGRAPSTISRELRRNVNAHGRYSPATADRYAVARQARVRDRRVSRDVVLHAAVVELLAKRWSPEQVAHELLSRFPGQARRHMCTESIYQAIYDPQVSITRPVVRRRRHRRRRLLGLERRGRIPNMAMISDRPAVVNDRVQVGHWEGDCIMGTENGSAIVTLVERVTRYLILVHLPGGVPTIAGLRDGITGAVAHLPVTARRSLTWDQGKELGGHAQITALTGMDVYFCDAHSPWQRGSNENMNGLLRDYFPKRTDLRPVTARQLAEVAAEINHRPRKSLGWARPAHLFATHPSQ